MVDLTEKDEKLKKLFENSDLRTKKFIAKNSSIEFLYEIVSIEENTYVLQIVLNRLSNENIDNIEKNIDKFLNSKNLSVREWLIERVTKETLIKMALEEEEDTIAREIIRVRFYNSNTEFLAEDYDKLLKAKSGIIFGIAVRKANLGKVCEMAANEKSDYLLNCIFKTLENKDVESVKEYFSYLSKSKSSDIRKFVIKNASTEMLLEMAVDEEYLAHLILERLEKIDKEIIANNYDKLIKAKSYFISEFALKNAPIEKLLEILVGEEDDDFIIRIILDRLENEDNTTISNNFDKLINSKSGIVSEFAIEKGPIEKIYEMAVNEDDETILKLISKRLDKEDKEVFINNSNYLIKSKSPEIRRNVVMFAPISELLSIIPFENDEGVLQELYYRLKSERYTEELKKLSRKFSKAKDHIIRECAVEFLSLREVVEMSLVENNDFVLETITIRLKNEDENEVKKLFEEIYNNEITKIVFEKLPYEMAIEIMLLKEEIEKVKSLLEVLEL